MSAPHLVLAVDGAEVRPGPHERVRELSPDEAGAVLDDELPRLTTGWRLRIVGTPRAGLLVRAAALARGALDEEITVEAVGDDGRTVFCAHCHHVFPTAGRSVGCPACELALVVDDHVSPRHGAHLGVPV
ncbi:dimethylamine monooxygenase subunit DmmA family protein [Actinomycetospora termitidis]|uniref:Dimethylamine monooxygenase subunit DmmA family protein n=1 Tax=Actinomycetospora termitidis TaxID=3053470 RepID=A0ABT7MC93_9PSEU|nr:dimethylamine monooxygenase subunit DmmA family protein [Actinomycetospora sp. Odt1-22]MDL5158301.1 dimethylamine monooxygenase subunit DmmA family protein [Actinomycetospora sp. Odt1-22]